MKKKVVYISGPITGVLSYREAFEKAEKELAAAGFIPLSPAWLPEGLSRAQYMRIDLAMLDSSDAMYQLRGWTGSSGAFLENDYCDYTDKPAADNIEELKEVLGDE